MVVIMAQATKQKTRFYFHITDTYGGETNSCWIRRYFVNANSLHGALCIISRETGYNFKLVCEDVYHAKNACIALLLESWETIDHLSNYPDQLAQYKNVTE
jgi:hypothetical protein